MGGATSPLPATPIRNRTNAKIKPFTKTAQYRNQISTLLGVSPLSFLKTGHPESFEPAIREALSNTLKAILRFLIFKC